MTWLGLTTAIAVGMIVAKQTEILIGRYWWGLAPRGLRNDTLKYRFRKVFGIRSEKSDA